MPVNTVQFKQVVRLPALDGKATPVEGKALPARKPRAQPAGLKASYAPIGVVQGPKAKARSPSPSSESSDDETTPVPPGRPSPVKNTASSTSHVPASSAASSGKAKRKFTSESEDSEGSEESDSSDIRPSKKAKIQEDQVRGTSEGLSNKSKTPKKTPIVPPVPGIQKGSSSTTAPKKPAIPVPQQRTNEMKEAKSKGEAASGPPLILGKMTPIPPPLPSTGRQSVTPVPVPAPAVRASISQSPTPDTVASTSKEKHKKHGKAAAGEERAADAASGALQVAIPPRDGQEKRKPGRPKKDQSGEAKEAAPDAPKASMGISDEQPAPRKHGKPKKDRPAEAEDASRKHKDKSKDKTKGEASEKSPEMAPQPKKVTKILPPAIPGLASR